MGVAGGRRGHPGRDGEAPLRARVHQQLRTHGRVVDRPPWRSRCRGLQLRSRHHDVHRAELRRSGRGPVQGQRAVLLRRQRPAGLGREGRLAHHRRDHVVQLQRHRRLHARSALQHPGRGQLRLVAERGHGRRQRVRQRHHRVRHLRHPRPGQLPHHGQPGPDRHGRRRPGRRLRSLTAA